MALQDILDNIKKEGELKLQQLAKEFEEKVKKLEKEHLDSRKKIDEDIYRKIDEKSKKIIEKTETLGRMESQNAILEAKRRLIETLQKRAVEKLAESKDYEIIIVELLRKIDIESGTIFPCLGKEESTKKAVQKSGKDFSLSNKSIDFKGGFLFKTESVEIDFTFESLILRELKDDLEIKLNQILFK